MVCNGASDIFLLAVPLLCQGTSSRRAMFRTPPRKQSMSTVAGYRRWSARKSMRTTALSHCTRRTHPPRQRDSFFQKFACHPFFCSTVKGLMHTNGCRSKCKIFQKKWKMGMVCRHFWQKMQIFGVKRKRFCGKMCTGKCKRFLGGALKWEELGVRTHDCLPTQGHDKLVL